MITKINNRYKSKETTTSSMFSNVSYDETKKIMTVTFRQTHRKYEYRDISKDMYNRMIKAASAGHFFNTYIKNVYQYKPI